MFKIANLTDTNKRIRLTALDSAMSNIDDSVGAIAKDGKDVLICLSPMVDEIPSNEIPPNEMYFTTTAGSVEYWGNQGDQIFLSDGTIVDVTVTDDVIFFNAPAGKHKLVLVETRDYDEAHVGGETLVEINNFPTLSSVRGFTTHPHYASPNLVKVPTVLPSNLTRLKRMFSRATSFNQDISMWDTSNVTEMDNMFELASAFNQDLSQWCVSNITSLPYAFDQEATNWTLPRPVWGTCPIR